MDLWPKPLWCALAAGTGAAAGHGAALRGPHDWRPSSGEVLNTPEATPLIPTCKEEKLQVCVCVCVCECAWNVRKSIVQWVSKWTAPKQVWILHTLHRSFVSLELFSVWFCVFVSNVTELSRKTMRNDHSLFKLLSSASSYPAFFYILETTVASRTWTIVHFVIVK